MTKMRHDFKMNNKRTKDQLSRVDERDNNSRPSQCVVELIQVENSVLKSENVFLKESIEIMASTISKSRL